MHGFLSFTELAGQGLELDPAVASSREQDQSVGEPDLPHFDTLRALPPPADLQAGVALDVSLLRDGHAFIQSLTSRVSSPLFTFDISRF
jgi:hypothetical protein